MVQKVTRPGAEALGWRLGDCIVGLGSDTINEQDDLLAAIAVGKEALMQRGIPMRFIVERAGNQRNQQRRQVFDTAMEQAHQLHKGKGNVQECERANTGATAAPKLSVGQQRRHRKRATTELVQREGRAACGYVDNPMRQDAGRQARHRHALMRESCAILGEPPPAWAATRVAGKAQSHIAKAMGL